MSKKNILLLCGGGSSEHEVSLRSVKFFEERLALIPEKNVTKIVIEKDGTWKNDQGISFRLDLDKTLRSLDRKIEINIDYVIPCIHGYPGETGDLQSYLEMIGLDYLGCNSETSKMCFNKITTKMWASALGVENTPYIFLSENSEENLKRVIEFQKAHSEIVIKASNQGSSVGCYILSSTDEPKKFIEDAFNLSPFVLVEKRVRPRELEVSVYEFNGKLQVSYPGEIITPTSTFYTYEEKYSEASQSRTLIKAENVPDEVVKQITDYATKLYYGFRIRHLSRIDFFYCENKVYLNEINTFPGLTSISMFPKMMEANGHSFTEYLKQRV